MSKARRLRKTAKKATGPAFYEQLQESLQEAIAWVNGEIPLRVTVVTANSRTVKFCKIGDEVER